MKQIQPVAIWNNGVSVDANTLFLLIVSDNLINTAKFYYQLLHIEKDAEGVLTKSISLAEGNLSMPEEDYAKWGEDGVEINLAAYQWAAKKLNVQLV